VEVEGTSTQAVILNLSARGVFVRTNAKAHVGTPAVVRIRRPGGAIWELDAEVVRLRGRDRVPASARGLGLEVIWAPPGFEEFVAELARLRVAEGSPGFDRRRRRRLGSVGPRRARSPRPRPPR
jgi:hypothetical protein